MINYLHINLNGDNTHYYHHHCHQPSASQDKVPLIHIAAIRIASKGNAAQALQHNNKTNDLMVGSGAVTHVSHPGSHRRQHYTNYNKVKDLTWEQQQMTPLGFMATNGST